MKTSEMLLRAILLDLSDGVARLAYADALEEDGHPAHAELARAVAGCEWRCLRATRWKGSWVGWQLVRLSSLQAVCQVYASDDRHHINAWHWQFPWHSHWRSPGNHLRDWGRDASTHNAMYRATRQLLRHTRRRMCVCQRPEVLAAFGLAALVAS